MANPIELIEQVLTSLEFADSLDAEDILNIKVKLREALRLLNEER